MPLLTLQFDPAIGPIIRVGIAYPASLHQDEETQPSTTVVNMLVDSGASSTSISPQAAQDVGLPQTGMRPVQSVNNVEPMNEYLADMYLPIGPTPYHLRDLTLVEFRMGNNQIGGLLGRDLLQHGHFQMNGIDRTFTLAF